MSLRIPSLMTLRTWKVHRLSMICLCLPLHTADCERTFSIQNQILTTKHNRLSPEISDKLIRVKIHGKGLKEENFQGILEKWQKNSQEVEIQNLNLFKLDYFNSWFYIRDLRTYSLLCGVTDTDIDTFCSLRKSQIMKCDNPM